MDIQFRLSGERGGVEGEEKEEQAHNLYCLCNLTIAKRIRLRACENTCRVFVKSAFSSSRSGLLVITLMPEC